MNLYFAGYEESAEEKDDILLDVIFNRLYAYNKMMNWKNEHMYDNGFRTLMLDSGAAGKDADKIDLDKYIHYCKHNRHKVKYFVNLDIIPRGKGPEEKQYNAQFSWKDGWTNWERFSSELMSAGIERERLIHVHHEYEPFDLLERMVDDEKLEYIGLSPAKSSKERNQAYLDKCMSIVLKDAQKGTDGRWTGTPKCNFHGFGVSTDWGIKNYPWYSVDSTLWAGNASRHIIFVPVKKRIQTNLRQNHGVHLLDKWDFSEFEKIDIGNIARRDDYWLRVDDNGEHVVSPERRLDIIKYVRHLDLMIGKSLFARENKSAWSWDIVLHRLEQKMNDDLEYKRAALQAFDVEHTVSEAQLETERVTLADELNEIERAIKEFQHWKDKSKGVPLSPNLNNLMEMTEEGTDSGEYQWWEQRIRYGLVHDLQYKMYINVVTLTMFAAHWFPENTEDVKAYWELFMPEGEFRSADSFIPDPEEAYDECAARMVVSETVQDKIKEHLNKKTPTQPTTVPVFKRTV